MKHCTSLEKIRLYCLIEGFLVEQYEIMPLKPALPSYMFKLESDNFPSDNAKLYSKLLIAVEDKVNLCACFPTIKKRH